MKTIILMTAIFLTVAFARPAAAATERTFYYGYMLAVETAVPEGDKVIIDGNGTGISSLGKFTLTSHTVLDFVTNRSTGTQRLQRRLGNRFVRRTATTTQQPTLEKSKQ